MKYNGNLAYEWLICFRNCSVLAVFSFDFYLQVRKDKWIFCRCYFTNKWLFIAFSIFKCVIFVLFVIAFSFHEYFIAFTSMAWCCLMHIHQQNCAKMKFSIVTWKPMGEELLNVFRYVPYHFIKFLSTFYEIAW